MALQLFTKYASFLFCLTSSSALQNQYGLLLMASDPVKLIWLVASNKIIHCWVITSKSDVSFFRFSFSFSFLCGDQLARATGCNWGRQSPTRRIAIVKVHCTWIWQACSARHRVLHTEPSMLWTKSSSTPGAPTDQATKPDQAQSQRQSLGSATLIGYDASREKRQQR